MTQNPCIICVAITGSLPKKSDNPAVPITIGEQIELAHEAFEAGATIVHAHVRNDEGGPDLRPRPLRPAARRPAPALSRPDRPALDRRPLRGGARARRHARPPARHGLARRRLQQLPDAGLREQPRPRRLAGLRDAGQQGQARDRGLRPQPHLPGGGDGRGRRAEGAALRPVRHGREERHAGRSPGVRLLRRDAEAPRPRRRMVRRRHRTPPDHPQRVVRRPRRPRPHRPRGQRPHRSRHPRAVERRPRPPRRRSLRPARAPGRHPRAGARHPRPRPGRGDRSGRRSATGRAAAPRRRYAEDRAARAGRRW